MVSFSPDREMMRGGVWMILMRWSMRGIGLVSTLILARLLEPTDFGIIAMAMMVVGLLEILSHLGVDLALIRLSEPDRADYDSAWTLQLLISAGLAAVIFATAPLAAGFFDEPKLLPVVQALSARALIIGFSNIGTVDFRRHFDFAREFRYNVYKKLAGFVIVVTAAVILRNYWALVIGMTVGVAAHVMIGYAMHPYRPRVCFERMRGLLSYSFWMVGSRIVDFATMRIDQLLVGRLGGTQFMGNYHLGFELATLPTIELVQPIARGVYPTYARQIDQPEALFASYLKTLGVVALLCTPISLGLAAVADEAVPLLLGEKWREIIPFVEALSVFGLFFALYRSILPLMQATGHLRLAMLTSLAQIPLLAAALYLAATEIGLEAVASARLAVGILVLPLAFWQVKRATGLSGERVARGVSAALWHRLAPGIVMFGALWLMPDWSVPSALLLLIEILSGAVVFVATALVLWWVRGRPMDAEYEVMRRVIGRLGGKKMVAADAARRAQESADRTEG